MRKRKFYQAKTLESIFLLYQSEDEIHEWIPERKSWEEFCFCGFYNVPDGMGVLLFRNSYLKILKEWKLNYIFMNIFIFSRKNQQ